MKAFDENGKTLEISNVGGLFDDDIQFELTYIDDPDKEVSDATYEYVLEKFYPRIYETWFQNKVDHADMLRDQERDEEAEFNNAHGKYP